MIKNHPFTDGNKRIGSLLFVHFLDRNACLSRPDGSQRFDANALVAVALLVAESDPAQQQAFAGSNLAGPARQLDSAAARGKCPD